MSPQLEQLLHAAQQLSKAEQLELITRLLEPAASNSSEASQEKVPWENIVGSLKDDPFFDEYLEAIAQYRRDQDQQELESGDMFAA